MSARRHAVWASKMLLDLILLTASFLFACLIRFEGDVPPFVVEGLSATVPMAAGVQFLCLAVLAPRRSMWRHLSLTDALRVAGALTLAGVLLAIWRVSSTSGSLPWSWMKHVIPWGVIVFDLLVGCVGLIGVRVACRLLSERRNRRQGPDSPRQPTLLIGAGRAGAMVVREIAARPEIGLEPVGFLDDDLSLMGLRVSGVPVLGPTDRIAELARRCGARQVLITIANGSVGDLRRISRLCRECGLPVKIIPPPHEIVGGRINLARIRPIAVEDLLPRDPVRLAGEDIRATLRGRRVCATGAGGSIGSELCRTVCGFGVGSLILIERAENSLFEIHRQLVQAFPEVRVVPCLADIRDPARMNQLFDALNPEVIFHAAAHKHVPLMESNPCEAIKNNVLGTAALARLAHERGVDQFVMISTDKAVKPSSVMGASKRVAELFVQAFAQKSRTRFITVRFGNVLGSNGSVVPLFREQIARGGPVTVTHPEMRRYFMTIPEACQLVLQAAVLGTGGEIFILDMGEQIKIVDLARNLICLSGLVPDEDVQIQFTGLRPGEKLSEELFSHEEDVRKTSHPRIFVGRLEPPDWTIISRQVEELGELAIANDIERMHAKLREIVPDYQLQTAAVRAGSVSDGNATVAYTSGSERFTAAEVSVVNAGTP
jgi:FlaA1/EpsC-like NDP-sugar epimerase